MVCTVTLNYKYNFYHQGSVLFSNFQHLYSFVKTGPYCHKCSPKTGAAVQQVWYMKNKDTFAVPVTAIDC